jgi:NADPH-dependent 2,4-dienoyl-CoA reductase/sulfur reductase-like enzyme
MHLVVIGGSDAGISAALRARELDPSAEVTVVVADAYPNFSICGIPYYVSGEVPNWQNLAHRSIVDLEAAGLALRLGTTARAIDVAGRSVTMQGPDGDVSRLPYDELVAGTGALPVHPPIDGLAELGVDDEVHVLHSMGDTFALMASMDRLQPSTALIVGAGYVGLEMADALTLRGLSVIQIEMLAEVLPTVDPELGALVHAELHRNGVKVHTRCTVTRIAKSRAGAARLHVEGLGHDRQTHAWDVDLVLVVVGVRPDTSLLTTAGARAGARGAIVVDQAMRTGLPGEAYWSHRPSAHISGRRTGSHPRRPSPTPPSPSAGPLATPSPASPPCPSRALSPLRYSGARWGCSSCLRCSRASSYRRNNRRAQPMGSRAEALATCGLAAQRVRCSMPA